MALRKVIKIRSSLLVILPAGDCELMGIEKGDRLRVDHIPGVGFLVTKQYPGGEVPVQLRRVESMKQLMDSMYDEFRRKVKGLEQNVTWNIYNRMMGAAIKEGRVGMMPLSEDFGKPPEKLLTNPGAGAEKKQIPGNSKDPRPRASVSKARRIKRRRAKERR